VVIGELNAQSKDIINLEIGNIPPKTKVKITISFVQEMTLAVNMYYSIQVPSTISPRYMNSIPPQKPTTTSDAPKSGNVSAPAPSLPLFLPSKKVSANPGYTWDFDITLKTSRKILFYISPSHKLVKVSRSEDGLENKFSLDKETVPNKDFVFVYTPEDYYIPDYVSGFNGNTTTVMVSFIPKFSSLKVE